MQYRAGESGSDLVSPGFSFGRDGRKVYRQNKLGCVKFTLLSSRPGSAFRFPLFQEERRIWDFPGHDHKILRFLSFHSPLSRIKGSSADPFSIQAEIYLFPFYGNIPDNEK